MAGLTAKRFVTRDSSEIISTSVTNLSGHNCRHPTRTLPSKLATPRASSRGNSPTSTSESEVSSASAPRSVLKLRLYSVLAVCLIVIALGFSISVLEAKHKVMFLLCYSMNALSICCLADFLPESFTLSCDIYHSWEGVDAITAVAVHRETTILQADIDGVVQSTSVLASDTEATQNAQNSGVFDPDTTVNSSVVHAGVFVIDAEVVEVNDVFNTDSTLIDDIPIGIEDTAMIQETEVVEITNVSNIDVLVIEDAITIDTAMILDSGVFVSGTEVVEVAGVVHTETQEVIEGNVIGRDRDYALYVNGAEIVPEFSSTSTMPSSFKDLIRKAFFGNNLGQLLGQARSRTFSWTVLLEQDVRVGYCWKFEGSEGHVAIGLAVSLGVTHVTLFHPLLTEQSERDLRRAPKQLRVWALLSQDDVETFSASNFTTVGLEHFGGPDKKHEKHEAFVRIGEVVYDPKAGPKQVLQMDEAIRHHTTSLIVIDIVGNWGADDTCLYPVSIHGLE